MSRPKRSRRCCARQGARHRKKGQGAALDLPRAGRPLEPVRLEEWTNGAGSAQNALYGKWTVVTKGQKWVWFACDTALTMSSRRTCFFVSAMNSLGERMVSSRRSKCINDTNKAHDLAWQLIDLLGLNSMSVNPLYLSRRFNHSRCGKIVLIYSQS